MIADFLKHREGQERVGYAGLDGALSCLLIPGEVVQIGLSFSECSMNDAIDAGMLHL